jgi:hypothetical protein
MNTHLLESKNLFEKLLSVHVYAIHPPTEDLDDLLMLTNLPVIQDNFAKLHK